MRRASRNWVLAAVTVVAAVSAATPAVAATTAADEAAAERHIKAGVELRRRGDDQAALGELTKAYQAARTPRASAQLALCEQSLARWVDAHEHMLEALAAKDDAWIKKNWSTLQAALVVVRQHTARIEVVGSPAGAEVSVAGRGIGRLPMAAPVLVAAGPVDLEVTSPGWKAVQRPLTLDPEGFQRVLVRLEREGAEAVASASGAAALPRAPAPPASAGAPAGGLVAAPSSSRAPSSSPSSADESPPFYARPWFWVVAGAVVAAGVAGALYATRGTEYPTGESRTLPQ